MCFFVVVGSVGCLIKRHGIQKRGEDIWAAIIKSKSKNTMLTGCRDSKTAGFILIRELCFVSEQYNF